MGKVIAIASILLALLAAGSIAYIAWELTAEPESPDDESPPDKDPAEPEEP